MADLYSCFPTIFCDVILLQIILDTRNKDTYYRHVYNTYKNADKKFYVDGCVTKLDVKDNYAGHIKK